MQIDNLPLPTVEDYFSSIEHLDNLFINKIDPGKYFPIDEDISSDYSMRFLPLGGT